MDALPAAGMVEEQKFFDQAGMHLAVFGQLHGRLGRTVGLACSIQAERVGLGFYAAGDRKTGGQSRLLRSPPPSADPLDRGRKRTVDRGRAGVPHSSQSAGGFRRSRLHV